MLDVLLVAATERELAGRDGFVCGVGPVEAAAATARTLALRSVGVVLHIGVAGGRGLPLRTVVVGTEAVYADIAAAIPVLSSALPSPGLLAAARAALPEAPALPITTSATVGRGRAAIEGTGIEVEAMEGFGVLRAAALAGVPALEVRAVSNEIGEEDRSRWDVAGAVEALHAALPLLLTVLAAESRDAAGQR